MHLTTFLSLYFAIGALSGPPAKPLSETARVVATAFNAIHIKIVAIKVAVEGLNNDNVQAVDTAWAAFFSTIEDATTRLQDIQSLTVDDIGNVLGAIELFTNDMRDAIEHRPLTLARVQSVIEANGYCGKFYSAAVKSTEHKDAFVKRFIGKIPPELVFPILQYKQQWDMLLNKMQWRYAPGNCTDRV
ncbi:hypothetical protein CP533_2198 [Ophiocordyceps camponoti-saundersi (nom. inval.)]|nr:hypothetical protein CP533_2198 [Ophiocordyceps camponoti-saundersi (nom. inval.)]